MPITRFENARPRAEPRRISINQKEREADKVARAPAMVTAPLRIAELKRKERARRAHAEEERRIKVKSVTFVT